MTKQVIVNNYLISYQETSGDAGKTLLFLHGWRSNKEIWQNVLSKLSIVNCHLFALDLPGFGGSQIPMHAMTVGGYAEVVAGFIKKLELTNVIIIGHSFGGRIGIKLAAGHPELISKLILADSAGFAMPSDKKNMMKIGAKIVKPFFKPEFMHGLRKKIYKSIGAEDYLATPELQKTFVNITSEDLSEDMKKITVPTLIINGKNDKDTPPKFGELMKFLIPNSKFLILKHAGHFSFSDEPEEFAKAVGEFIT
ncbi:MAG: alpha/beta hydrolase [Candidatus Doudnabacteria bacterium]|nr:alpha/beta hydrolase [Candidatus Doudnabacteria bacterium]